MGFIEAYKKLEKLCSETMGPDRPVTAYIEEMKAKPDGAYYVPGWEEDLKRLKHYRHIRNKIAHDPGCTEKNMCAPGDAAWLVRFHGRILRCEDPLTLYRKAKMPKPKAKPRPADNYESPRQNASENADQSPYLLIAAFLIIMYLILRFIAKA